MKFFPSAVLVAAIVAASGCASRIYGDEEVPYGEQDADGDHVLACKQGENPTSGCDCDDKNKEVNPNHVEVCSTNVDDNCNGQINEGCGDHACGTGTYWDGNQCVPDTRNQCRTDTDCGNGYVCQGGRCMSQNQQCHLDRDCAAGEYCDGNGDCVTQNVSGSRVAVDITHANTQDEIQLYGDLFRRASTRADFCNTVFGLAPKKTVRNVREIAYTFQGDGDMAALRMSATFVRSGADDWLCKVSAAGRAELNPSVDVRVDVDGRSASYRLVKVEWMDGNQTIRGCEVAVCLNSSCTSFLNSLGSSYLDCR